jgi:hypothetical protein
MNPQLCQHLAYWLLTSFRTFYAVSLRHYRKAMKTPFRVEATEWIGADPGVLPLVYRFTAEVRAARPGGWSGAVLLAEGTRRVLEGAFLPEGNVTVQVKCRTLNATRWTLNKIKTKPKPYSTPFIMSPYTTTPNSKLQTLNPKP